MDEMRTKAGQGKMIASEKTDPQFTIDFSVSCGLAKNISLYANVINLTDEVYIVARRPAGIRPGMPRTFSVGVKANF